MVNISIPVHGVAESVIKPTVIQVVEDVKSMLHVSKDIYVQYANDKGIGSDTLKQRPGKFNNIKEWISVDYEEESFPDMALVTNTINPDYKPICRDDEIGLLIQPIYHNRKLNIIIKYHSMSKSRAMALMSTLNSMPANDAHTRYHELEYFYNVGNYTTSLLNEIVLLKNTRLQPNEQLTLESYIRSTFDDRVDLTYSQDAKLEKAELVIREAQLQVVGYIEENTYDMKLEFDTDIEQWVIEIPYTINYEKITNLKLRYPILVYNNLIHKQYRVMDPTYNIRRPLSYRGGRVHAIHEVTKDPFYYDLQPLFNNDYLTIPKDDNVILPNTIRLFSRLFSVMCILNPNDTQELFNIKETPGIRLKQPLLDLILTSEYKYIGKFLNSIIYMELYENFNRKMNIELLMDKDGNIRSNQPLDIKKTYRVMFSIVNDISKIDRRSHARLTSYLRQQIDHIKHTNDIIEPLNIYYYSIFDILTPYKSKDELLQYATEDIKYGTINPRYDIMRTVATNQVIISNKVFDIVESKIGVNHIQDSSNNVTLPKVDINSTSDNIERKERIDKIRKDIEEERKRQESKEQLNKNVPTINKKQQEDNKIEQPVISIEESELSNDYQSEILSIINKLRTDNNLNILSIDNNLVEESIQEILNHDIDSNGIDYFEDMYKIWKEEYNFLDPDITKIAIIYLYRDFQHYWNIKLHKEI